MSRPEGSSTYHYSAKSHSPIKIFQWVATEYMYIILNALYTEKDPEFCVQLFCIEIWPFSQFLQKCHNSRPQWYKACITSEIFIRDDIIFGLKITHKTALPSRMLIFLHLFVNYLINHIKNTENQIFYGQIFVQNGQNLLFVAMATTLF